MGAADRLPDSLAGIRPKCPWTVNIGLLVEWMRKIAENAVCTQRKNSSALYPSQCPPISAPPAVSHVRGSRGEFRLKLERFLQTTVSPEKPIDSGPPNPGQRENKRRFRGFAKIVVMKFIQRVQDPSPCSECPAANQSTRNQRPAVVWMVQDFQMRLKRSENIEGHRPPDADQC